MRKELTQYDLSYGDFVLYNGIVTKVVKVMSNGYWYTVVDIDGVPFEVYDIKKELEPLPITPEILEQNNFIKKRFLPEYMKYVYYKFELSDIEVRLEKSMGNWRCTIIREDGGYILVEINYVHELQHTLRLLKVDKEIKL